MKMNEHGCVPIYKNRKQAEFDPWALIAYFSSTYTFLIEDTPEKPLVYLKWLISAEIIENLLSELQFS